MEKGRPPLRLRHSFSARCRLVEMVLSGLSPQAASMACGMSRATAYRLCRRYHEEGWEGLRDRRPVAKHHPHRLSVEAEAQIIELRRRTNWGPQAIAAAVGRPASTIWRVLKRHGESRAYRAPRPVANRYEYAAPASWCTWTPRSWDGSGRWASASTKTASSAAAAPAGSTPTSPSMTIPAGAWRNCTQPKTPQAVPASWSR